MTYSIEVWQAGNVWYAETPDKDTFRHTDLAHAIGEIFKRVTVAIQNVPCNLMNASTEEIGKFMMEHGPKYGVVINYPFLDPQTNPSHPLNLYESLVTGTR